MRRDIYSNFAAVQAVASGSKSDGVDGAAIDLKGFYSALLAAAQAHVEWLLGFKLNDAAELPDGAPADLELAVLQLAADWYENREATLVGVSAMAIPFGAHQVVNEYRRYTFGASGDGE